MSSLSRFVVVGDTHGNEIATKASEALFDFLSDFRPHVRIHGGDLYNFAALRKKASPHEQRTAIAPDYEAGNEFFDRYFSGGTGAKQRFQLWGNHDRRIFSLAEEADEATAQHYAAKMVSEIQARVARRRVVTRPYDSRLGVLDVGGLRVLHGYAAGIGSARKFASVYGAQFSVVVYCHTHAMDLAVFERYPEPSRAVGTGCMCAVDQGYNHAQTGKLRHEVGFLYGYTQGTRAEIFQARWIDGRFTVASAVKTYDGRAA